MEYDVPNQWTLQQLADLVDGRVVGDPGLAIHGLNGIEFAAEGELTFVLEPKRLPLDSR